MGDAFSELPELDAFHRQSQPLEADFGGRPASASPPGVMPILPHAAAMTAAAAAVEGASPPFALPSESLGAEGVPLRVQPRRAPGATGGAADEAPPSAAATARAAEAAGANGGGGGARAPLLQRPRRPRRPTAVPQAAATAPGALRCLDASHARVCGRCVLSRSSAASPALAHTRRGSRRLLTRPHAPQAAHRRRRSTRSTW
jgi:hypothetical protein